MGIANSLGELACSTQLALERKCMAMVARRFSHPLVMHILLVSACHARGKDATSAVTCGATTSAGIATNPQKVFRSQFEPVPCISDWLDWIWSSRSLTEISDYYLFDLSIAFHV